MTASHTLAEAGGGLPWKLTREELATLSESTIKGCLRSFAEVWSASSEVPRPTDLFTVLWNRAMM